MKYTDIYKEAAASGQTKQLIAQYFEFKEKGVGFVGKLIGVQAVTSKLGGDTYNQYLFETDDGLTKCSLGRAADGEVGVVMKIGGIYSIIYLGQEDIGGGRRINRFDITGIMSEEEIRVGGDEDQAFDEDVQSQTDADVPADKDKAKAKK